jgi:glycosyltransferase involved in cell wall biosynthesis
VNVHQILAGAGPHDAVTGQALAYRARFRSWGWGGSDHATFIAPGAGPILPRAKLAPAPADGLVLHHSAVAPGLGELLALPNPKVLVYHNITPARWLWDVAPVLATQCAVGRGQLPEILARVQSAVAVSQFNADELARLGARDPVVVPLLLELGRLGRSQCDGEPAAGERAPTLLFVGRLSPHKRQDELIRTLALLRGHRQPDARLVLVGEPVTVAYGERLEAFAEAVAPGAVRFRRGLSDAELGEAYRAADVFVCLSEHEGFCLPVIEAARFGLPVLARAAGAVPETLGGAGLLLEPSDDLTVAAELVHLALTDEELRAELARRGVERVAAYEPEAAAGRLRGAIERALSSG